MHVHKSQSTSPINFGVIRSNEINKTIALRPGESVLVSIPESMHMLKPTAKGKVRFKWVNQSTLRIEAASRRVGSEGRIDFNYPYRYFIDIEVVAKPNALKNDPYYYIPDANERIP